MKTSHWYKVLVLGGAALSAGCLQTRDEAPAPDAATTTTADAGRDASPAPGDAADPADAAPGCRVPCGGGVCWG